MDAQTAIRKGLIKKYDALRKVFFSQGATCRFLSGDGELQAFKDEFEVETGWYLKYSELRGNFKFYIAIIDDSDFADAVKRSAFVAINDDVYQIIQGDTVRAGGNRQYWSVYCVSTGGKV